MRAKREPIRLIMVGGFLGAGKTTLIARLAGRLAGDGRTVAVVTNDQAANLVDTQTLRGQGLTVGEVAGACFCCAFDELTETLQSLTASRRPDVLLAEPVGSCTDLAATVLRPIRRLYPDRYVVSPLAVLVDPGRARKVLRRSPRGGFSPQAAYLYEKQLEEADAIVINKVDLLGRSELGELTALLADRYPGTPVLSVSARTGDGLERLLPLLVGGGGSGGEHVADVDYDLYAAGEAELGWLNATIELHSNQGFDVDTVASRLLEHLYQALHEQGAEVGHLKIVLETGTGQAVGNLVGGNGVPELSRRAGCVAKRAALTVNARAFLAPDELSKHLRAALGQIAACHQIRCQRRRWQHFRPARPVPTHRDISLG